MVPVVAAWAIDHPGQKPDFALIFPSYIHKLKEQTFLERRTHVARLARDLVQHLQNPEGLMDHAARDHVQSTLGRLRDGFGYCDRCARDAAGALLAGRYREIL